MTIYYKATDCGCGCGGPLRPKTHGRSAKYIHGHNPTTHSTTPLIGRFWTRVNRGEPDDCWTWSGGADHDGRGRVWHGGRNIPAPRAALMLSGIPVPPGAMVCHHCDNPPCCNPAHLYVGDALSNVRDMDLRGRRIARAAHPHARGELNHNVRLSDSQVIAVRTRYTGRRGEQSALAREYGVSQSLIHMIVRGKHRA